MPITQKLQQTSSFSNGMSSITGYDTETGNAIAGGIDQYFKAGTANQSVALAFTLAGLQSIVMVSDKGCTLKTNGTTGADVQTISITGTPTAFRASRIATEV